MVRTLANFYHMDADRYLGITQNRQGGGHNFGADAIAETDGNRNSMGHGDVKISLQVVKFK